MTQDTDLLEAVQREDLSRARRLLTYGAGPASRGASFAAALGWAALRGSVEMVELLLGAGADVNAVGATGIPPLTLAVAAAGPRRLPIAEHRSGGSDLDRKLQKVRLLVELGADLEALAMLPAPNEAGAAHATALCAACLTGNEPVVRLLLTLGADANQQASDGSTALPCPGPGSPSRAWS